MKTEEIEGEIYNLVGGDYGPFPKESERNGRFYLFNERDELTHIRTYVDGEPNGLYRTFIKTAFGKANSHSFRKGEMWEGEEIIFII